MILHCKYLRLFLITFSLNCYSQIYIFTTAFNMPSYLEMQCKSFKKFLKDDYKFIVFSDANNTKIDQQMKEICNRHNVQYINFPQDRHKCVWPGDAALMFNDKQHSFTAAFRHGEVVQYAFETIGFNHNDIVMLIDSDVFLISDFSIREYVKDNQICGRPINIPNYAKFPLAELMFLNIPLLPHVRAIEFRPGFIAYQYLDTCAFMRYYMHCHPEIKFKDIERFDLKNSRLFTKDQLLQLGYNLEIANFLGEYAKLYETMTDVENDASCFFSKVFLNYSSGSFAMNFLSPSFYKKKNEFIMNFLRRITE